MFDYPILEKCFYNMQQLFHLLLCKFVQLNTFFNAWFFDSFNLSAQFKPWAPFVDIMVVILANQKIIGPYTMTFSF